ncbi:MAG: hypothetical protein ACKVOW_05785 [Chitinophagaceae bacterium]
MTIAFIHNNKAFLPGLYGYRQFFNKYGIQCEVVTPDELGTVHRQVEWYFLGSDISKPKEGIYKIHEYPSASLPPFRKWKDWMKSFINTQPDYRVFQNEFVRNSLNFHDSVPFGYRELGIPEEWLSGAPSLVKEYDFIYIGDVSASRKIKDIFNLFTTELRDHSLLILSHRYEELKQQYIQSNNIIFKGPVQKDQVREFLLKSKFAINYIPDSVPFNKQTSTKLLEYITCKVPVISTRYRWMDDFEKQQGGGYFYLEKDLSNFTWERVNNFKYSFPVLSEWTWEKQIRKSGVLEFLLATFPELKF